MLYVLANSRAFILNGKAMFGIWHWCNAHSLIYNCRSECEKQVIGYPKSKYKKFLTKPEADEFLSATESEGSSSTSRQPATTTTVTGTFKGTSRDTIIGVDQSKTKINTEFEEKVALKDDTMTAFTDGAASGNGTKRAHAGIGVYWGPNDKRYERTSNEIYNTLG
ncbi:hypothetical protein BC943DRAFT_51650 [Umbelopsis sp. AD052]|nr:hypothetical protein BC943DRAFT_51650 [Umbelopsis sp. AD052]